MSRNGSGPYSLPQPAFVTGTVISSSAMNSNLSDIAAALTQSISADGQTPITGAIKFSSGNAATPGITFGSDSTTGIDLNAVGKLELAAGGVSIGTSTSSATTWSLPTTFSGVVTFSSTLSNGTQTGIVVGKPPSYQAFTSGSGTYTPTSGVIRIKVRMCGGGASGGAAGGGSINLGAQSSFGSTTAKGTNSQTGGTGGTTGTGTEIIRLQGGTGGNGTTITTAGLQVAGGTGGASFFGNTPAPGGGGQGSNSAGAGSASGLGGGAGEYVEFFVNSPTAQSYTVGGGGSSPLSGGTAGSAGIILVEEFYN